MKKNILLVFLVFNVQCLYAQESVVSVDRSASAAKEKSRELGIFSQFFHETEESGDQMLVGLQFRRQVKPQLNFRVLAAYHRYQYTARPEVLESYNNDSLRMQATKSNANMLAVGIGLEVQRHFYKRVWLFADAELLAGLGTGKTRSSSNVLPFGGFFRAFPDMMAADYKEVTYQRTYIRLVPGVGAKIVFDRVNFGLETQFASIGIASEKVGDRRTTLPGIHILNNIAYRFQVNYRF